MTKEEILNKWLKHRLVLEDAKKRYGRYDLNIIEFAMDEYAMEVAIGFANWKDDYMCNPPIGKLSTNEELFNQYLKS